MVAEYAWGSLSGRTCYDTDIAIITREQSETLVVLAVIGRKAPVTERIWSANRYREVE